MEPLNGRTALVTGGAKRIGRAVCEALARAGANVAIHYRTSDADAESLAEALRAAGREAWTVRADLDETAQAEGLLQQAVESAGQVDILVNSAAIFPRGTLMDLSFEDLERSFRVNAYAPFALARAFARQELKGSIINILDNRIVLGDPQHVPYHLSKRALFALTRMLAMELAPDVRVNAVAPGLILPPPGEDESYLRRTASANPLQRWGSPEQVAAAVLFLVRTDFVTGQVLFIDGGQHMKGALYG